MILRNSEELRIGTWPLLFQINLSMIGIPGISYEVGRDQVLVMVDHERQKLACNNASRTPDRQPTPVEKQQQDFSMSVNSMNANTIVIIFGAYKAVTSLTSRGVARRWRSGWLVEESLASVRVLVKRRTRCIVEDSLNC